MNMPNINLPAKASFRGVDFNTTGPIKELPKRQAERFMLNAGNEATHVTKTGHEITLPLVGTIADLYDPLQTMLALPYGSPITPERLAVESLNTSTDVITISAHGFTTGDAVTLAWLETAPTLASGALSRRDPYYVRAVSADTLTLHPSSGDAGTNSNKIDFTAAGSGFYVCKERPLVLTRYSGVVRTYHNAAIVKYPSIMLAGGKRFFSGDLVFRAYPKAGGALSEGDDAFFTETGGSYSDPSWDSSKVLSARTLDIAWGSSAPWDDIPCEAGVEIMIEPQLDEIGNGLFNPAAELLKSCKVTAKLKLLGITVPEYDALFAELVGAQLTQQNLTIYDGYYVHTLKNAAVISPQPKLYGSGERVTGEITFEALGNEGKAPFSLVVD